MDEIKIDLSVAQRLISRMGTATSLLQANPPREYTDKSAGSEWGREILRKLHGMSSHILPKQDALDAAKFPQMLSKMLLYARRSQTIGMNAFRVSFELCELSPKIGEFDEKLMLGYIKLLLLLRFTGHEPMVTLHHYTNPMSLVRFGSDGELETGAWEDPLMIEYLRFAVRKVIASLKDKDEIRQAIRELGILEMQDRMEEFLSRKLASEFVTVNEPIMSVSHAYILGIYPPFKKARLSKAIRVRQKIKDAHRMMYHELKTTYASDEDWPFVRVGMAYNWARFHGLFGPLCHKFLNEKLHVSFFEDTGDCSDFLALQYYFGQSGINPAARTKGHVYGDHPGFGYMDPEGICHLLKAMHKPYPKKDIMVTEFGFADKSDMLRPYLIMETFRWMIEAINAGVPLVGIYYWSLVHNFEWLEAMTQEFGLFRESELDRPLVKSNLRAIRGWEALKTCADVVLRPEDRSKMMFQANYNVAKLQYLKQLESIKHAERLHA